MLVLRIALLFPAGIIASGQLRTPSFFSFKDIMKGNKDDQCGIMVKNFNLKTGFILL
jgi:hypothetical protein